MSNFRYRNRLPPNHPNFVRYRGLGSINPGAVGGDIGAGAAVGGPIGAGVGAVVGIVQGILSNHENVAQVNADKSARENLAGQYSQIQGTVPGRQVGLASMINIWKGAAQSGHWPSWSKQGYQEAWIDAAVNSNNGNCFPQLWKAAQSGAVAGNYHDTGNNGIPVRDARTFVDRYFWPANSQPDDTNPWATDTDAFGHQIIYDTADAYLSQVAPSSIPYIAVAPSTTPAPIPPTPVTVMPTPLPVGQPLPVAGGGVTVASLASAGYVVAGTDTTYNPPLTVYQQPGGPLVSLQNGQLIPYTPPQGPVVAMPAPAPLALIGPTATSTSPTVDPSTQALINQLLNQGATQQQAYTAALQQLQQQGIAATPQVQQQVSNAVAAAPAPVAAAGLFGSGSMGTVGLLIGGVVLLSIFLSLRHAPVPQPMAAP